MSPGKRGLVLLQLILHLSNASHPILIDQPEDNLDNRTIYFQLKQFVREKKLKRQIIFVTHNANLIISTDSENIIAANQDGQQAGKDNREFKFEYVSGAIENTFTDDSAQGILYKMGIREHVCDILEGGKEAFQEREEKYGFK
jgi:ABC-type cobalamin/Fe3+-siderophores transport system ATPase subunit